jgi:protein-tyrosine-phosphatase
MAISEAIYGIYGKGLRVNFGNGKNHIEQIGKIAPELRGKTMLFGHWLQQREIPDPYKKSEEAFSQCIN